MSMPFIRSINSEMGEDEHCRKIEEDEKEDKDGKQEWFNIQYICKALSSAMRICMIQFSGSEYLSFIKREAISYAEIPLSSIIVAKLENSYSDFSLLLFNVLWSWRYSLSKFMTCWWISGGISL